jgi:GH15 family glucan-1,4-alpha-glucosidase
MSQNATEAPKLSDYALIGNSRAAALVCNTGAIEWCCLPEFDSPAIFAALLDREKGGHFSIAPLASFQSKQRYLPDTNVVETSFQSEEGEVRLLDAFTAMSEEDKEQSLFPDNEILRVMEGVSGKVRMRMEYSPRTYYGKHTSQLKDRKKLGIHFSWKGHTYTLLSTLKHDQIRTLNKQQYTAVSEFTVEAWDRLLFPLNYSSQSPVVLPELHN